MSVKADPPPPPPLPFSSSTLYLAVSTVDKAGAFQGASENFKFVKEKGGGGGGGEEKTREVCDNKRPLRFLNSLKVSDSGSFAFSTDGGDGGGGGGGVFSFNVLGFCVIYLVPRIF